MFLIGQVHIVPPFHNVFVPTEHDPDVLVVYCLVSQRAADLAEMITRVIREGLEGLVLKDLKVRQK